MFVSAERDEDEGCGCPFDYEYTCPACGHKRITNHCPHDRVQNPCPRCKWVDPGKETPLQFLQSSINLNIVHLEYGESGGER